MIPSKAEEEYFFQQEVEKLKKLADEHRHEVVAEEREKQKKLHWMRCCKCGEELQVVHYGEIEIDRCFGCGGVWLDDGELEKIVDHEEKQDRSLLSSMFGVFKKNR